MIVITFHAIKRGMERFNWTREELRSEAIAALEVGNLVTDDPFLKDLFRNTINFYENSVYYYNNGTIFVFDDDRLITVFPLNGRYSKTR